MVKKVLWPAGSADPRVVSSAVSASESAHFLTLSLKPTSG